MSEAGASTSKSEVSSDVDVEAATLLSQGRRNLLVGDAPSAVQSLEEAAALLGSKYGELANECGETYYFYGWALLELSRMETGVLGNALDGVPDEEQGVSDGEADNVENPDKLEEKEREKIFHDVQDALESKDETEKKNDTEEGNKEKSASEKEDDMTESGKEATDKEEAADKEEPKDKEDSTAKEDVTDKDDVTAGDQKEKKNDKENKNDKEETKMDVDGEEKKDEIKDGDGTDDNKDEKQGKDEGAGPSEEKAGGVEGDGAEGDGDEEDEDDGGEDGEEDKPEGGDDTKEDEVSNFQLSWEMLELARVIFSKQEADDKEFKLKVAQVYLKLGELGLETGQYTQSIEDFTQCLTRQKEQLEGDSRLLAETYYNLALANSFDQKFDKAIESFEQSTVVIKNRIATLKKKAENQTEKPSEEDLLHDQKEMKELELLIPEIKVKIEDAKAEKNSAETAAGQAKTSASKFDLGASSSSSSSGFAPCSSSAPAKPIAVRKAADAKPDDVSHLVHRKRKPEEQADEESAGKKSRSEDGSGDASTPNGINGSAEKIVPNGDAGHSPEKPEIKVKQVEKTSNGTSEPAVMET